MLADDIYECRIQGDVCPPTLKCLKQEDGAYACRCEKKGYVVKGDDQERTCEGTVFSFIQTFFSYHHAAHTIILSPEKTAEWFPAK